MTPRVKRTLMVLGGLTAVSAATALTLNAFSSNLVFFYTPTQVAAQEAPQNRMFRIGGLVEEGSVKRDGVDVHFGVTDTEKTISVTYRGILPDLFKEGKGVVAQGKLGPDGQFRAQEVLAKHDENYMPPEAAEALEQARKAREAGGGVAGAGAGSAGYGAAPHGPMPKASYGAGPHGAAAGASPTSPAATAAGSEPSPSGTTSLLPAMMSAPGTRP
jgi:cytochrome c-type biogenesis protein CcmE